MYQEITNNGDVSVIFYFKIAMMAIFVLYSVKLTVISILRSNQITILVLFLFLLAVITLR